MESQLSHCKAGDEFAGSLKALAYGEEPIASGRGFVGFGEMAEGVTGFRGKAKVFRELGKGIGFGDLAAAGFVGESCHECYQVRFLKFEGWRGNSPRMISRMEVFGVALAE